MNVWGWVGGVRTELEVAVDTVLGVGEVTAPVLCSLDVVVGTGDGSLVMGNEGVDPRQHVQIARCRVAKDDGALRGDRGCCCPKAGQTDGGEMGIDLQGDSPTGQF